MTAVSFNQSNSSQVLANREQRQDARIQQGIQSGQLTPAEAQRLQGRESRIDAAVQRQEAQPGGLTAAQFARDTFRMDGASLGIWWHKHNGSQVQPPQADPTQGADPTQAAGGSPPAQGDLLTGLQGMVSQLQQLVQQLTGAAT